MHIEHLIRMANQIGAFFESLPDRTEGLEGAAQHLKKFWEPRMRSELFAYVDGGGAGLTDFMMQAIAVHRGVIQPIARHAA